MNCHACSRRTLSLFIRSFVNTESATFHHVKPIGQTQPKRSFFAARRLRSEQAYVEPPKPFATNKAQTPQTGEVHKERPAWQIHKEAVKEKLGGAAWNPRKKLSPDTMEGIRHLHQSQPQRFTTSVLAQHFKVSPEAVRRILKSRWRPSDEEHDERLRRWDKRGEKIWTNLVELGIKPPKRWREMGVGRAGDGKRPRWKTGSRNSVRVNDSVSDEVVVRDEAIIPIVDGPFEPQQSRLKRTPMSNRFGV